MKALIKSSAGTPPLLEETNRIFAPLVAVAEKLSATTRQIKDIRNFFLHIIILLKKKVNIEHTKAEVYPPMAGQKTEHRAQKTEHRKQKNLTSDF
jgi:hypothetical protein